MYVYISMGNLCVRMNAYVCVFILANIHTYIHIMSSSKKNNEKIYIFRLIIIYSLNFILKKNSKQRSFACLTQNIVSSRKNS
jgi:hypothetical protein